MMNAGASEDRVRSEHQDANHTQQRSTVTIGGTFRLEPVGAETEVKVEMPICAYLRRLR